VQACDWRFALTGPALSAGGCQPLTVVYDKLQAARIGFPTFLKPGAGNPGGSIISVCFLLCSGETSSYTCDDEAYISCCCCWVLTKTMTMMMIVMWNTFASLLCLVAMQRGAVTAVVAEPDGKKFTILTLSFYISLYSSSWYPANFAGWIDWIWTVNVGEQNRPV